MKEESIRNKMVPEVSIIIPVYNISEFLGKCIQACISQTLKNIEIIIINDGSTDDSEIIIGNYASIDSRIFSQKQENLGLPTARKVGVEKAKGNYIFFLDGDDFIPLNCIEVLYSRALKTKADIVMGSTTYNREDGSLIKYWDCNDIELVGNNEAMYTIFSKGRYNIWGKLYKRSLFKENQILFPSNISIGEDLIANIQLFYFAKNVAKTSEHVYYYVRHENSLFHRKEDRETKAQQNILLALGVYEQINRLYINNDSLPFLNRIIILRLNSFLHLNKRFGEEKQKIISIYKSCFFKNKNTRRLIKEFSNSYFFLTYIYFISPLCGSYLNSLKLLYNKTLRKR